MNLSNLLREDQYQSTIYLNDRPYEVLDIGEGKCKIMIVDCIKSYLEQHKCVYLEQRLILVDVSKSLRISSCDDSTLDRQLASDLHLLFDVFWLGEIELVSELSNININTIYDVVRVRNTPYLSKDKITTGIEN